MRTVLLAGGTGSGKSTVARALEARGWHRIDLDALSRSVLEPGSPTLETVAREFGSDLIDASGLLDRALLAQRAFASPDAIRRLEAIELPAIRSLLAKTLAALEADGCERCLVEVPLPDRLQDDLSRYDEILVVRCPEELRRQRALARGMTGEDFDARVANQPSDAWLAAHATAVLDNAGTHDELLAQVDAWLVAKGW